MGVSGSSAVIVGETISGFKVVRELSARVTPTYIARRDAPAGPELVILQRFQSSDRAAVLLRCAADVSHPSACRIKSYDVAADEVVVVSELVEGETLSQLLTTPTGPPVQVPLEISLRMLLDVLAGLRALHEAKDSTGRPLRLVHGQLSRDEILVGVDGLTRVTTVARGNVRRDARYIGYLAPEVLLAEETPDPRADLYSVGVHLWEALAGRKLFDGANLGQVLSQQMNSPIPRPQISQDALWAVPLVEVALKALSPDKKNRFGSALEMSEEIAHAAAGKIGEVAATSALLESLVGARVRERKQQLSVPLARNPSNSAVRRQNPVPKAHDDDDDDPTVAEAREEKAPDSGEIPTEVHQSMTVRKSRPADEEPAPDTEVEDETVTTKAPKVEPPPATEADYADDSVTRPGVGLSSGDDLAYLEETATAKKARPPLSDVMGAAPNGEDLQIEDDPEDDSITSQAPAQVTRLLRMVAEEVNQAKHMRTLRPAAGAPPPASPPNIPQAAAAPHFPAPLPPPPPTPVPVPIATPQATPAITRSSHPPPQPSGHDLATSAPWNAAPYSPELTGDDIPAPSSDRTRVIVVVTFFVLSAAFCLFVVVRSLGQNDERPTATPQPNAEEPVVETLAPDPLGRPLKPGKPGAASASASSARAPKPFPKRR